MESYLKKNPNIAIDPAAPFNGDALGRKSCAESLALLIRSADVPFVIAVESPWGTGKTVFLRMLEAQLRLDGHPCMYLNAWEADTVQEPTALLGVALSQLSSKPPIADLPSIRSSKIAERLKRSLASLLRLGRPFLVSAGTTTANSLFSAAGLPSNDPNVEQVAGSLAGSVADEILDRLNARPRSISDFNTVLAEIATAVATDPRKRVHSPIVTLIDELDRCRPAYAVEMLESLKHLFSTPGYVFVLAIDRDQLNSAIRSVYGSETDAGGYLRRFIDLRFRLPPPGEDQYSIYLTSRFNLEMAGARRGREGWEPEQAQRWIGEFSSAFAGLARVYGLSLRVQEHCFTRVAVALKLCRSPKLLPPGLLATMIVLHEEDPDFYRELATGSLITKKAADRIEQKPGGGRFLSSDDGIRLVAVLHASLSSTEGRRTLRDKHAAILARMPASKRGSTEERTSEAMAEILREDLRSSFAECRRVVDLTELIADQLP